MLVLKEAVSKFDIPRNKQNFTDAQGKPHPIWAKAIFKKSYKSFDELYQPKDADAERLTEREIWKQYMLPHAQCLHTAYMSYRRQAASFSDKKAAARAYIHKKMQCYKDMVHAVERIRGEPLTQ